MRERKRMERKERRMSGSESNKSRYRQNITK
jgi:hypothetical protein